MSRVRHPPVGNPSHSPRAPPRRSTALCKVEDESGGGAPGFRIQDQLACGGIGLFGGKPSVRSPRVRLMVFGGSAGMVQRDADGLNVRDQRGSTQPVSCGSSGRDCVGVTCVAAATQGTTDRARELRVSLAWKPVAKSHPCGSLQRAIQAIS